MSTKSETKPESMSPETKPESPSTSSIKTVSVDTNKTLSVDTVNVDIVNIYDTKNKLATDILALVSNNDEFTKLAVAINFKIGSTMLQNMLDIIKTLSHDSLNNVVDELNKIFADGKLEAYEVPKLISVIVLALNKSKIKKIDHINVGYLIKCLLLILTHFSVIKLNNTDMNLIFTIIDDTVSLLDIPVKFSKKCCFFF
jgi:hypothetical protein